MPDFYLVADVCGATGATPRVCQWLDEREIVNVRQESNKRLYTLAQVVEVALWVRLREKGIGSKAQRKAVASWQYLTREGKTPPCLLSVSGGKSAAFDSPAECVKALAASKCGWFVVDMVALRKGVEESLGVGKPTGDILDKVAHTAARDRRYAAAGERR